MPPEVVAVGKGLWTLVTLVVRLLGVDVAVLLEVVVGPSTRRLTSRQFYSYIPIIKMAFIGRGGNL